MAHHIGQSSGHGAQLPEDMAIPIFFAGKEPNNVSLPDLAPAIADILYITPDAQWEGKALPKP